MPCSNACGALFLNGSSVCRQRRTAAEPQQLVHLRSLRLPYKVPSRLPWRLPRCADAVDGTAFYPGYHACADSVAGKGEAFISGLVPEEEEMAAYMAPLNWRMQRLWSARQMAAAQLPHEVWSEELPPILSFYSYCEVVKPGPQEAAGGWLASRLVLFAANVSSRISGVGGWRGGCQMLFGKLSWCCTRWINHDAITTASQCKRAETGILIQGSPAVRYDVHRRNLKPSAGAAVAEPSVHPSIATKPDHSGLERELSLIEALAAAELK